MRDLLPDGACVFGPNYQAGLDACLGLLATLARRGAANASVLEAVKGEFKPTFQPLLWRQTEPGICPACNDELAILHHLTGKIP